MAAPQQQQEQQPPRRGHDFYDDGYDNEDEELTQNNRIVFDPRKFFGRKEELHVLKDAYYHQLLLSSGDSRHQPENNSMKVNTGSSTSTSSPPAASSSSHSGPPVIIIEGFSGNGKSSLVRRFVEQINEDGEDNHVQPLFLSGKYQELQGGDPCSGILDALSGLCDGLAEQEDGGGKARKQSQLARIRMAIRTALGDEVDALTAVVPGLARVMGESVDESSGKRSPSPNTTPQGDTPPNGNFSWNRMRYLFQKLFVALCTEDCPVILFLDDLQWADAVTLGLMVSLLQNKSLQHFMFIGALRGNEVGKDSELNTMLHDIETTPEPFRSFTRIELLNLSIDELGEFVADTLHLSEEETLPLTEIIYGKTRGNIFFSMQLIEELHRRNILFFSVISFRWEWNLEEVEFESDLSENVIAAVASKIQSLPEKLQRSLIIASYTRASIDVRTLLELLTADSFVIDAKELVGLLDIAVLEGLLFNTVGSDVYKFAHDRIQQAAYWMVPSGKERDELRILIGRKLVQLYSKPDAKDWMVFVAADHLNSCTSHGQDRATLVQLNLVCGERAFTLAAFVPASLYLRLALKSLRKLDDNPWESHYDLCLRVYRGITDIELCLGNPSGFDLGKEVISRARSLDDKIPTYLSLVRATGQKEEHAEALALCQDALFQLKAIPTRLRTIHFLKDAHIVKRLFRTHSDYDILLLPSCQDRAKATIMEFLTEYALRSYHCGNKQEFVFCVLRAVRMAFQYGLSGSSAHAFASYGVYLQRTGSTAECPLRMARLARKVLERTDPHSRPTNSLTLVTISFFLEAWSLPRENIMESLKDAQKSGMATGNMEMGFLAWALCNIVAQATGYPLEPVEATCSEILSQTKQYNVVSVVPYIEALRLSIQCLNGQKCIDWDELDPTELTMNVKSGDTYRCLFTLLSRLELGVYFGNLKFAIRMSDKLTNFIISDSSFVGLSKCYFFAAIAYAGLGKEYCSYGYRSKARRFGKKLKHLCRTRGVTILHKSLLVDAELLSIRCQSSTKLIAAYDDAVYAAVKAGYTHDAALGSELAGASLLGLGEESRGHQYLTQARDLWREYGAHAKVQHLNLLFGRKMDKLALDTLETVGEHQFNSGDLSDSRRSIDLDLLSGTIIKNEIRMKFPAEENVSSTRDIQDESSILTDPSASSTLVAAPGPLSRAVTQ